jgi:hypothetical protein
VRSVCTSCGTAVFEVASVHVTRLVPKKAFTASSTAVDQNPCPDGYSG